MKTQIKENKSTDIKKLKQNDFSITKCKRYTFVFYTNTIIKIKKIS